MNPNEIKKWEELIAKSRDIELVAKFYNKIGKNNKAKEIISNIALENANYQDIYYDFSREDYNHHISDENIDDIVLKSLNNKIEAKELGRFFCSLDIANDAVLEKLPMEKIVNDVIKNGINNEFKDKGILKVAANVRNDSDLNHAIDSAYSIFEKYGYYVKPSNGTKILTLKTYMDALKLDFKAVSVLQKNQLFDEELFVKMFQDIEHINIDSMYGNDGLIKIANSQYSKYFKNLKGSKEYGIAKRFLRVIDGKSNPNLKTDKFAEFVCDDELRNRYSEKTGKVVEFRNGYVKKMRECFYGITSLDEDIGPVKNKQEKFSKLIDMMDYFDLDQMSNNDYVWTRNQLYNCGIKLYSRSAFETYSSMSKKERESLNPADVSKLMVIKLGLAFKDLWQHGQFDNIKNIYQANKDVINHEHLGTMLDHVVFKKFQKHGRLNGKGPNSYVSYFLNLLQTPLRDMIKDYECIKPYFELEQFLQT